jgi:hypothetical protein
MMNWRGFERRTSRPNRDIIMTTSLGDEENHERPQKG